MKKFQLIDHIQTEIAVIDKDMIIVDANKAFKQRHDQRNTNIIGEKCFNAAYHFTEDCGQQKAGACPARRSFLSKKSESAIHHYWIDDHAVVEELSTTPILNNNGDVLYVIEEFRDISKLLGLNKGIIGICSYCRKIRDKDGTWITFEAFLQKHTGAYFSHGICEECNEVDTEKFNAQNLCSH